MNNDYAQINGPGMPEKETESDWEPRMSFMPNILTFYSSRLERFLRAWINHAHTEWTLEDLERNILYRTRSIGPDLIDEAQQWAEAASYKVPPCDPDRGSRLSLDELRRDSDNYDLAASMGPAAWSYRRPPVPDHLKILMEEGMGVEKKEDPRRLIDMDYSAIEARTQALLERRLNRFINEGPPGTSELLCVGGPKNGERLQLSNSHHSVYILPPRGVSHTGLPESVTSQHEYSVRVIAGYKFLLSQDLTLDQVATAIVEPFEHPHKVLYLGGNKHIDWHAITSLERYESRYSHMGDPSYSVKVIGYTRFLVHHSMTRGNVVEFLLSRYVGDRGIHQDNASSRRLC